MRIFLLFAALAACGDPAPATPDAPTTPVSFTNDVHPLINHCGSEMCHGGLATGSWAYDAVVGQDSTECDDHRPLVVAGDPDHSYFVAKLEGHDMCNGERMPKGQGPLPDAEIAIIRAWIAQGAVDDGS